MPRLTVPAFLTTRRLATAALTLLAACGGDDPTGPTATGNFSGNVAGDVTRALTGPAYYGQSDNNQDGAGFAIGMGGAMSSGSSKDLVALARRKSAIPAPGTYALHDMSSEAEPSDDDFMLLSTLTLPNGTDVLCLGTSGTLTVQAAGGGHVKGSYTAQASCLNPADLEDEIAVTLTGNFDAVQGTRVNLPNANRIPAARAALGRAAH